MRLPALLPLAFSSVCLHAAVPLVLPTVTSKTDEAAAFSIQWDSVPGQGYLLQRSPSLESGTWEPVGERLPGTGAAMSFSEPAAGSMFYRLDVADQRVHRIAFMGDSITELGNGNLRSLSAFGYYNWARVFNGSQWDPQVNGSTYRFATGGKRSDEVSALHRDAVIASGAEVCVIAYGTNDAIQLRPPATFIAQAESDWAAFRAAGIRPVAVTVLPMGSVGGAMAERQARVAEFNMALRASAAAHGVPLCDWTGVLEAEPGSNNGIGIDSNYSNNDNLHPKQYPCSLLGRALAATLAANFVFGADPWENLDWITVNTSFNGIVGQPDKWYVFPPSGGAITGLSRQADPQGNWWQLSISSGTSTGNFSVNSFEGNVGGSARGKLVEATAEVQVISGSLDNLQLQVTTSGIGLEAADLSAGARSGAQVRPEDGIVVLRTMPVTVGASDGPVTPGLYFNTSEATAVLRIRRCGVRQIR